MSRAKTALVTGGAGLIGSHIVDAALAAGWDVRVLDNTERQTHRDSTVGPERPLGERGAVVADSTPPYPRER